MIAGIGRINGDRFDDAQARAAVLSYDYTVLAGTQGQMNHRKKDRLFALIERLRLPVVLFAEGGGGRPGDTDTATVTGLDTEAFALFGGLSGLVPLVGVVSGRCFAGNAALLGCCDVIIATPDANIGMGGPAMIEGGGLGAFAPEEIGPFHVQVRDGVVDVAADDEADAVRLAKQYLSYFQGPLTEWSCADQELLRDCVPEDRRRAYDVHAVLDLLADTGSVLELRPQFAPGMVSALIRLEGRPLGVLANNPLHLAGAIDARLCRQGGAVHAALRGVRPPAAVPMRHAGIHGRPRGGGDRPGPARQPDVRHRGQPHRALLHGDPAQGLRTGGPGHGRGELPPTHLHRGLAHRRTRRHGPRGRGAPRLPP